jgi:hypothetical protein
MTSSFKTFYFLFIPLLIAGCNSYRKVVEKNSADSSLSKSKYLNKLIDHEYYLVIHNGNNQQHIKNLWQDTTRIWNAEAEVVDSVYEAFYLKTNSEKVSRYKQKEIPLLQQAHLFINDSFMLSSGKLKFDIASVKIETLKSKDYVGIPIGIGLFFLFFIAIANSEFNLTH